MEFKRAFPSNAQELAKEVAAFATSNDGLILVGVDDRGGLVGIDGLEDPSERDAFKRRVEGLCSGPVTPQFTPEVYFASEDELTVAVIAVPKGTQPIYYYRNVPYLRHVTTSRPATPTEVIDLVVKWRDRDDTVDPLVQFKAQVATELGQVLMWASQFEGRGRRGGAGEAIGMFGFFADALHNFASDALALECGMDEDLEAAANACREVRHHSLTMGRESWAALTGKVELADKLCSQILHDYVYPTIPAEALFDPATESLATFQRRLAALGRRAVNAFESGGFDHLQSELGQIGRHVAGLAFWGLDRTAAEPRERLRAIGEELSLWPLANVSGMDRVNALVAAPAQLAERLAEIQESFSESQK